MVEGLQETPSLMRYPGKHLNEDYTLELRYSRRLFKFKVNIQLINTLTNLTFMYECRFLRFVMSGIKNSEKSHF